MKTKDADEALDKEVVELDGTTIGDLRKARSSAEYHKSLAIASLTQLICDLTSNYDNFNLIEKDNAIKTLNYALNYIRSEK